jgi:plastocyanin
MKKILTATILFFMLFSARAQVLHTVNGGNFYYSPQSLTINVGDTVSWINDGGFHNVNFDINTISGLSFFNPESFLSTPTNDVDMYTYVFTVAGTYQYDCSVGQHAANGMVGTIIVNNSTSIAELSFAKKEVLNIYSLSGKKVSQSFNIPLIYQFSDGSIEKKVLVK